MEKFTIGLALGMLGGALLVANSCKVRTLVKKSQDEVKEKLDTVIDEKLEEFSATDDETEENKPKKKNKKK